MRVCYFGNYKSNYSRNQILIRGLKLNQVEVLECNSRKRGLAKYIDLWIKHHKIRNRYDVMVVGFPGYQSIFLAYLITNKKIIFDAFTSIYDSMIFDRREVKKNSIRAKYYYLLDRCACKLARVVLLDTAEHINYFVKQFKLSPDKFRNILVGSDDSIIKPQQVDRDDNKFIVHFHGTNIPLQGVEYIIEAAELLKNSDIYFNIIGSSIKNQYKSISFKNIDFLDDVPYEDLSFYMSKSDVCLGIFGNTDKAKRVIPNKVFEAMATKCPIITGRSKSSLRFFKDKENIIFANMADARDLADKILFIKNNKVLTEKISDNAYKLFKETSTPKVLGGRLLHIINEIS